MLDVWVLDQNYETLAIFDNFISFVWTDRFREYGDFEIHAPASLYALSILNKNNYLSIRDSEHYMIIESRNLEHDLTDGGLITVTGRSLESILERRIVWKQTVLTGNLQNGIEKLLNENVINPEDPKRKIPGFRFKASTDPSITELTVDTQFFGDNLYDIIWTLCEVNDIGFKIIPEGQGGFVFELYTGKDRSYAQEKNPWIEFSSKYENLLSSNYSESDTDLKTAALVADDSKDVIRLAEVTLPNGGGEGLTRREMFIETYGITEEDEEGNPLSESQIASQLAEKGLEGLAENLSVTAFGGEIDATRQFVYNQDFFIGDVVQVVNEYSLEARSRIIEVIRSWDSSGYVVTPTFLTIEDSTDEEDKEE